jgi:hypothetical protein
VKPQIENKTELKIPTGIEDDNHDHSQDTNPRGRAPDNDEEELMEIYLSCEITIHKNDKRGPHLHHAAVLNVMYNLFPKDERQLINNQNKRIQPHNYQKMVQQSILL